MDEMMSVIILCYHKFDFIYELITSVLNQTYDNIEIIVGDDGSPNFPKDEILKFIDKHKKNNIKRVIVNQEEHNVGTVKNFNDAISLANGKYIVGLAADDTLFDEHVLRNYVKGFKAAGDSVLIEMAQTAMCSYDLKKIEGYYLQPHVRAVLEKDYTSKELFSMLASKPYLPSTSTCFRKDFFEKFGKFGEQYRLVEDVPMHLKLAREDWKIHYENFVAIKHRTGGISHGSIGGLSKSNYLYYCDLIKIRDKEMKPYYRFMYSDTAEDVKDQSRAEQRWLKSQLPLYENNRKLRLQYWKEYPCFILKELLLNNLFRVERLSRNCFRWSVYIALLLPIMQQIIGESGAQYMMVLLTGLVCLAGICMLFEFLGKTIQKIERFPERVI